MKKLFGRNQIMIASLALMIAVAGYFNFAGRSNQADEEEVAQMTEEENADLYDISMEDIESLDEEYVEGAEDFISMEELDSEGLNAFLAESVESSDVESELEVDAGAESVLTSEETEIDEIPGEAVFTSGEAINNLADARLVKEQVRAKNKQMLQEMMENTSLSEKQKNQAVNSMIALTEISEKEMSAEILLEAKGFANAVVSITGDTADVCVASDSLSEAQCAQIIDIVQRKTGISPDKVVITPVKAS
ncbi:MAG: SpoIIIAH-like family protein [Lachnospiraceae bacterium]|nr:SpoIIIAH-like family protein [Lachnospiraceae bacterium]